MMMLVTGESFSLNFTNPPTVVSQYHLHFDRQSSQIDIKMPTLREGWGWQKCGSPLGSLLLYFPSVMLLSIMGDPSYETTTNK